MSISLVSFFFFFRPVSSEKSRLLLQIVQFSSLMGIAIMSLDFRDKLIHALCVCVSVSFQIFSVSKNTEIIFNLAPK